MKTLLLLSLGLFFYHVLHAQSFAINTDGSTANNSAILDVKSTTKGLLIPRMNKSERNAIATPAISLLIYQNAPDSTGFYYFDGSIWKWLSNPDSETAWKINGNNGTNPNTNYIGTNDNQDLGFRINGIERMRLTREASLGIGQQQPLYPLDIITGQAGINNCTQTGIRVKSFGNFSNNCDQGLIFGYTDPLTNSNDAIIWNYGNAPATPEKRIIFGIGSYQRMILTNDGLLGIGTGFNPISYSLDVITGVSGFNPCGRNGLRLRDPSSPGATDCDRGLFFGFDNNINSRSTSLWNFNDPANPNPDLYFRFGFGNTFDIPGPAANGESMRILPPGKGIGIGTKTPLAMLHIINNTGVGVLPGMMVTSPIVPPGSMGFYTGLFASATPNDGYVWNFQNAPAIFGTNDLERMRIHQNGNVGIGTNNPLYRLDLANGSFGFGNSNTRSESRSNAGLQGNAGAQSGFFETDNPINYPAGAAGWWHLIDSRHSNSANNYALQIAGSFFDQELWFRKTNGNAAQAWYRLLNSTNGWSTTGTFGTNAATNFIGTGDAIDLVLRTTNTERMRISAGGNVGIGTAAPNAQLQLSNSAVNRKMVLFEGANNDHQFYGLGINTATFRYQVDATGSDHAFFAAVNSTSSNELMRIKGNGNIGIGTSTPTKQTEIIGATGATPVTLVIGNRSGFGPAAMEFVSDYGQANQWRPGYIQSSDLGVYTGALEFYTNGTGLGNFYTSVKGLEVRNGVTYTATGTVSSWSDTRLKKNVQPFTNGLDIINKINPVSFYYNEQSPFQTEKMQVGILAQELEKVAPYMVDKNVTKDFNDLRSVNNQAYIFLLINAVKEQQKQIDEQRKMIEELLKK